MKLGFELNLFDTAIIEKRQHIDLINDDYMMRAYRDNGWPLFHVHLTLFYIVPEPGQ